VDHGNLRQLAAGAALDDLDPRERADLDAHLATCRSCQALAAELDGVLADLALVAPEVRPPASLKGDVLAAIRQPAPIDFLPAPARPDATPVGQPADATPVIDLAERRRWRAIALASTGLAAVLAIAAVGLGVGTLELTDQVADARAALSEARNELVARNAALTLLAEPGHQTASLAAEPVAADATAMVVFRPGSEDSYLMATDLPPTPEGQVYQLWFADEAGVHPLGTFHHDGDGPFVAPFGVDLGTSAAAMVTLEPEGGAQGEPGPQVVFGEF
jgi:hypothetical protein